MTCAYCNEEILPDEPLSPINGPFHRECGIRLVGSAEHINGECSCFRPKGEAVHEPEGLTPRESARRAARALDARNASRTPWPTPRIYGSRN